MARPVVLVTRPEYRRGQPAFASASDLDCIEAPPDEASLIEAVRRTGAAQVIIGSERYSPAFYAALPRGGVVARFGVGHDAVDKTAATAAGILCTNTPDVLEQSVAELTLLMIAAAARHFVPLATTTRAGEWSPRQGIELQGRTLAIVGCGAIGLTVARIAARGFGMRVQGYVRRLPSGDRSRYADVAHLTTDFAEAVQGADFVSLHIPAHPENQRFVDRERLGQMERSAWLVNTARGAVVDESALFDALAGQQLGGAVLDVFVHEPYVPVDPGRDLRTLDTVLMLPHVGSNTVEANRRMAERALRNVRLGAAGDVAAMDLLNPDVLPSKPAGS